jgi:oligopeptide/dipeptide ABC transporter ATP-binding protein
VDVTIQARILDLLRQVQAERGMSVLLITHDLGVVAEMANHVAVMYAGKIVEQGPVEEIFAHPRHPYTIGLFGSLPRIDEKKSRLEAIEGSVPAATRFPEGCRFRERCKWAVEKCLEEPPLIPLGGTAHLAACWRAEEIANGAPPTRP